MGSKSQVAFIYVRHVLAPRGPPVIQDGIPGSYMLAVFKRVAHEVTEIWTSLSHSFTKGGFTVSRVCVASEIWVLNMDGTIIHD